MTKSLRKGIRLSKTLDEKIEAAAQKRGMNWSEMVRHILTNYFFNGGQEEPGGQRDA